MIAFLYITVDQSNPKIPKIDVNSNTFLDECSLVEYSNLGAWSTNAKKSHDIHYNTDRLLMAIVHYDENKIINSFDVMQCNGMIYEKQYSDKYINPSTCSKVIFLDIDGVLNLIMKDYDEYGQVFHPHFVDNLKKITNLNNDIGIVMTSTWRFKGIELVRKMWQERKLPSYIVGATEFIHGVDRGVEIQKYLKKNSHIEKYVIIDDDDDMLDEQLPYFVKTSDNFDHDDHISGYGLTKQCAEKCIKILK